MRECPMAAALSGTTIPTASRSRSLHRPPHLGLVGGVYARCVSGDDREDGGPQSACQQAAAIVAATTATATTWLPCRGERDVWAPSLAASTTALRPPQKLLRAAMAADSSVSDSPAAGLQAAAAGDGYSTEGH